MTATITMLILDNLSVQLTRETVARKMPASFPHSDPSRDSRLPQSQASSAARLGWPPVAFVRPLPLPPLPRPLPDFAAVPRSEEPAPDSPSASCASPAAALELCKMSLASSKMLSITLNLVSSFVNSLTTVANTFCNSPLVALFVMAGFRTLVDSTKHEKLKYDLRNAQNQQNRHRYSRKAPLNIVRSPKQINRPHMHRKRSVFICAPR